MRYAGHQMGRMNSLSSHSEPNRTTGGYLGWKTGLMLIGATVLLVIAWNAAAVLLLAFAAILVGISLATGARVVSGYLGIGYSWALAAVTLSLTASLVLLFWLRWPAMSSEAARLSDLMPTAAMKAKAFLTANGVPEELFQFAWSQSALARAGRLLYGTGDALASAVLIAVTGIYLAGDPQLYAEGLVRTWPQRYRERARAVLGEMRVTLARWMVGRILLMVVNGMLTAIGLWALGIPLAVLLGLIAGILNFVPNLGPIVAAIPAILIGFGDSPAKALQVAVLYFVLQSADGYIFTPLVQKRTVSLPPALLLLFQVFMGVLLGTAGVLLATPLLAILRVLYQRLYIEGAWQEAAQ